MNQTVAKDVAGRAERDRLRFIDVLRGIAAWSVVAQHVFERSDDPVLAAVTYVNWGVFGVALFFLLSGFIIPYSVRSGVDARSFAIRRVMRIYPAVLAAFALWFVAGRTGLADLPLVHDASAANWAANLLLYHDLIGAPPFLGVTWTLSLEFGWYALFLIAVLAWHDRAGAVLTIAAPLVMAAAIAGSLLAGVRLPLGRVGMVYAAVLGFQAWRHFEGGITTRRFVRDAALFMLLIAAGCIVAFGYFRHPEIMLHEALIAWIAAPALFLAVQVGAIRRSWIMRNRVLAWLGSISFSTYLLHPVALSIAERQCPGAPVSASLALTFILSVPAYYAIERPAIALGRRWARRRSTRGT